MGKKNGFTLWDDELEREFFTPEEIKASNARIRKITKDRNRQIMTNYDIIQSLNRKLRSIDGEVLQLKREYETQKDILFKEREVLQSSIEKIRELNALKGLDANGNFKCKKCGSEASEHETYEEYRKSKEFGCHKCYRFYDNEKQWNEKNGPDKA